MEAGSPGSGSRGDGTSHLLVLEQLDVEISLRGPRGAGDVAQPRGGEVERRLTVRKRAHDAGAPPDLAQDALERVAGANPPPMLLWEGVVGERLLDRHFHQLGGAAQAKATQLLVVEGTWLKILRYQCTMGSLKKFGRTDSVIASDSRSAGAG